MKNLKVDIAAVQGWNITKMVAQRCFGANE